MIRVLLVDGHALVRDGLATMLASHAGIEVVGQSGNLPGALDDLIACRPDVAVLDVSNLQQAVQTAEQLLREAPQTALLATSLNGTWDSAARLFTAGIRGFVLKDKAFDELPNAIHLVSDGDTYISPDIQRPPDLFRDADEAAGPDGPTAVMICHMIGLRDPLIARHQRRVAELSVALAETLGMDPSEVATLRSAALMHDVGKLGVPAEVLAKPGALGVTEVRLVRGHCEAGHVVLQAGNVAEPIPELVYQHHERCDGSGYPRGLTGDQMLFGAKILAVADVVEAMLSRRPYRGARGLNAALEEIESGAGVFYDSEVAAACLKLFRSGGFAFPVE